jgi:hypothetical protein
MLYTGMDYGGGSGLVNPVAVQGGFVYEIANGKLYRTPLTPGATAVEIGTLGLHTGESAVNASGTYTLFAEDAGHVYLWRSTSSSAGAPGIVQFPKDGSGPQPPKTWATLPSLPDPYNNGFPPFGAMVGASDGYLWFCGASGQPWGPGLWNTVALGRAAADGTTELVAVGPDSLGTCEQLVAAFGAVYQVGWTPGVTTYGIVEYRP